MSLKSDEKAAKKAALRNLADQLGADPDGVHARCARMETMLRKFKAREGMLTVALVALQTAVRKGDRLMAAKFMSDILRDYNLLASCLQIMTDRDLAMKMTMDALRMVVKSDNPDHPGKCECLTCACRITLKQVEILDPLFLYTHAEIEAAGPALTGAAVKLEATPAQGTA